MSNTEKKVVHIGANDWTLFDKLMYGGMGYGPACLPSNFFKLILAILFPPLGEVINIIEDDITYEAPFITWNAIKSLTKYESITNIVYSFVLTTLFYIPGLVFTLSNISDKDKKTPNQKNKKNNSRD